MWRTAPLTHTRARGRSIAPDEARRRPRWRRATVAIGLTVALTGAGAAPAFAIPENQGVIAWGSASPLPIPAAAESNVVAVSVGKWNPTYALALKADGSVIGWGADDHGRATPPAEAQSGVVAISAGGQHALALKSDGSVIGWGSNGSGETTIPPAAQSGVVDIAAGNDISLAVKADGSVIGWGASTQATAPVGGLPTGLIAVDLLFGDAVGLKSDGTVVTWGLNPPAPPSGLSGVIAVSAGYSHVLALKGDGSVVGWGGPLSQPEATPPPAAQSGVIAVAAGLSHSLALKSDGSVIGWGRGTAAQPIPEAGSGVVAIAAGPETSLAVKDRTAAPTIAGTPPAGAVGEPYTFTYTVTGVPTATTTVTSGSLPPGLTLSADGVLSGTPTAVGEYPFEVTASNGVSPDAVIASTIAVRQAPTISGTPPGGTVGTAYSFAYVVTGDPAPTVTLLDGTSLPPGLSLSPEGVISGTPTTVGTYTFTVEASNGVNPTAYLGSTIEITPAAKPKADVSVAITGPATAKKGTSVSYQVAVHNAGPQTSVNVRATVLVSTDFTITAVPAGATRIGQLVTFPTASYDAGQHREFAVTVVPKASSGSARLGAAAGSLLTADPKLSNNVAGMSVTLTR